jgi:hypothetical protein
MVYIIVSYFTTDNNKKLTWHSYNLGSRSKHNNIYEKRFAPVQPPPPNSIKPNRPCSNPYPNPYLKTSIPRTRILYSSTSIPYERYPSHICADTDHRRRRPSARSPLLPSNLATAACKTVRSGHRKTVLRVSSGTIKTVRRDCRHDKIVIARQSVGCPARPSR